MTRCSELELPPHSPQEKDLELTRREFLAATSVVSAGFAVGIAPAAAQAETDAASAVTVPITLSINKQPRTLTIDTRTSLLDLLR